MPANSVQPKVIVSEGDDCPWFLQWACVAAIITEPLKSEFPGWELHGFTKHDYETNKTIIHINSELSELDRLRTFFHELIHAVLPNWSGKLVKADANRLFTALGIENLEDGPCSQLERRGEEQDDSDRWRPSNREPE